MNGANEPAGTRAEDARRLPDLPASSASAVDPMAPPRPAMRIVPIAAAIVVILDVLARLLPMRLRDDLYAGDAGQHTWWLYRFGDPSLFPNDVAARYMSYPAFSPTAYQTIFKLLPWLDPQRLCESLAIGLALLSAWLAWLLGSRIGRGVNASSSDAASGVRDAASTASGAAGGVAAIAIFVIFDLAGTAHEGGFPRSFGLPLLLAGVLAVMKGRWALTGLVFVLAALFYPPIVINLAPLAGILFLIAVWRTWGKQSRAREVVSPGRVGGGGVESQTSAAVFGDAMSSPLRAPPVAPSPPGRGVGDARSLTVLDALGFIVLGFVAVGIIASMYLRPLPADIGPWFTYDEAKRMPEWRDGGRTSFFRKPAILYFHNSMGGIGLKRAEAAIVAAALVVTVVAFPRAIPPTAWLLLVSGLAMWALAHATLFKLYLPSRYLSYVRPVFAMMWAAGLVREMDRRWHLRDRLYFPRVMTGLIALFIVMFAVAQFATFRHAMARQPWNVPAGFDDALAALRAMPKETLVAAHPDDGNAVPLRARRSVLTNTEVSVAFNKVYYADQKLRLEATFAMLYATDWATIDGLADAWGVNVFLVDRRRLQDPSSFVYFEPFRTSNRPLIEAGQQRGFALLNPPTDRVRFSDGDVMLVRVGGGQR